MDTKEDFVQIKSEYFLKGMYVDSDVFYIQDNRPVLFCKQTVITEDKIGKLRAIAEVGAPIFVSKESYERLIRQYRHLKWVGEEQAKKYREAKDKLDGILEATRQNGKIDVDDTVKLADAVNTSVNDVELSFIIRWISYMREADEYLCTHSVNVGILNGLMGKWMGLSGEEEKKLVLTGLLHDIGKTKISEEILNKPGSLSDREFEEIKKHPVYSWEILKASGITDENILNGARGHHEKSNGSGYPDGLGLERTGLYARITAISDIYDAMVAKRVYKEASTPFEVLDEFYRDKFSNLDIRLVDIFLNRMAGELSGREVILSDGRIGKIVYIEKTDFAHPVVQCQEEIINTNQELRCVSLCTDIG